MFTLSSPTIVDGQPIPARHLGLGHGENRSPALDWAGEPEGTKAFALRLVDDDAPGYQHWLVVLPGGVHHVDEGTLPAKAVVGQGTRALGYEGPCPPADEHHYHVVLEALATVPDLSPGFDITALDAAIAGHVLGSTRLSGTYRPGAGHTARRVLGGLRRRLPGQH